MTQNAISRSEFAVAAPALVALEMWHCGYSAALPARRNDCGLIVNDLGEPWWII
jgi:hypothetical protein